ncbi:MAG: hydrogenase maturation protease [Candidatus Velthaea sp.]
MNVRFLVAGVGNIFFGDDGFGPAVVRALEREPLERVKLEDFGIRGLHMAYELLEGYERALLIDALPRGQAPGTLYVVEPDPAASAGAPDAHSMDVQNVFAVVRTLGGEAPPITLVGCEPESIEDGIELSTPVARAVEPAAALVCRLIAQWSQDKESV